jgi:hypothetical protein
MSPNQSSSEHKFYLDFQKMLILKSAASTANVLASWALIMSYFEKPEVSETIKLPEKREPIKFYKRIDLMLGIEENSL